MALSIIRFDMRAAGLDPKEAQRLYGAALEMGEWADARGFDMLTLSEHHGSPDGYLPSPLVLAGAMAARTSKVALWISALLLPLHDPIRLAEDMAVIDLISGGFEPKPGRVVAGPGQPERIGPAPGGRQHRQPRLRPARPHRAQRRDQVFAEPGRLVGDDPAIDR